jgi:hypothetical protein
MQISLKDNHSGQQGEAVEVNEGGHSWPLEAERQVKVAGGGANTRQPGGSASRRGVSTGEGG